MPDERQVKAEKGAAGSDDVDFESDDLGASLVPPDPLAALGGKDPLAPEPWEQLNFPSTAIEPALVPPGENLRPPSTISPVPPLKEPSVAVTGGPPASPADASTGSRGVPGLRSTGVGRPPTRTTLTAGIPAEPSGARSMASTLHPKIEVDPAPMTQPHLSAVELAATKSGIRRSFSAVTSRGPDTSGGSPFADRTGARLPPSAAVGRAPPVRALSHTASRAADTDPGLFPAASPRPTSTGVGSVSSSAGVARVPSLPPPPSNAAVSPLSMSSSSPPALPTRPARTKEPLAETREEVLLGQSPVPFQTRASPEPKPSELETLGMFGKYRLVQHLAVGGMAQLYLASLDGPDGFSKQCVVKTILPEFAVLPDFNEMFVNEAKVAALLHHPNIVQVYDFGREGGRYFLAMEYVKGASLQQVLREAYRAGMTLGPRFAITIGAQMCDAMGYAQALKGPDGRPLNLVHRDLTTGNILISAGGVAKLTDFGIVKTELNLSATAAGVVKGKYPYMSPEQIRAAANVDVRADVWSLGVTLFEMLSGRLPFEGEIASQVIVTIVNDPPQRLDALRPDLPPGLVAVVHQCLEKNPDLRPASVGELAALLAPFASVEGAVHADRAMRTPRSPASSGPTAEDRASQRGPTPPRALLKAAKETLPGISHTPVPARPPRTAMWVTAIVALTAVLAVGAGAFSLGRRAVPAHAESPPPSGIATTEPRPAAQPIAPIVATATATAVAPSASASAHVLPAASTRVQVKSNQPAPRPTGSAHLDGTEDRY